MSILTTPLSWIERAVLFHFPSESHKNFKSKFHKVLDKHRWNLYWIKKCTLMNCLRDVKLKLSVDFLCLPKSSFLVWFYRVVCFEFSKHTHTRCGWKQFQLWTVFTCSILYEKGDFMFPWVKEKKLQLKKLSKKMWKSPAPYRAMERSWQLNWLKIEYLMSKTISSHTHSLHLRGIIRFHNQSERVGSATRQIWNFLFVSNYCRWLCLMFDLIISYQAPREDSTCSEIEY